MQDEGMDTPTLKPYYAEQLDGRAEDTAEIARMWSVIDGATGEVAASWRDTPATGMTEQEATELAAAWNALENRTEV